MARWLLLVASLICSNALSTEDCSTTKCQVTQINCPSGGDCLVICSSYSSCQASDISCPDGYDCTIQCTGTYSCMSSKIWAANSNRLTVEGCSADHSCWYISISCPPNNIGVKQCIINGDDDFHGTNGYPLVFRAINSWNDIDLTNVNYNIIAGKMYCMTGWSDSCQFSGSFSCICGPTPSPTVLPTFLPTFAPSASPTVPPTIHTNSPTKHPSPAPTQAKLLQTEPKSNPTQTVILAVVAVAVITVVCLIIFIYKRSRKNSNFVAYDANIAATMEIQSNFKEAKVDENTNTMKVENTSKNYTPMEIKNDDSTLPPAYEDLEGEDVVPSAPIMDVYKNEGKGDKHSEVKQWFSNKVELNEDNLETYCQIFVDNGFDTLSSIKRITMQDLIDINISKLGHRKQILAAVQQIESDHKENVNKFENMTNQTLQ